MIGQQIIRAPKTFTHDARGCLFLDLERITQPNGVRHYITPEGNKYPSVTTMLSATADHAFLKIWKETVGDEQAEKIKNYSARRGNVIHSLFHEYLDHGFVDITKSMPDVRQMVRDSIAILDDINNIVVQEKPLYSDELRLAGSPDCIGEYKGILSNIDFKNARNYRSSLQIRDYFLQCTAYALMFEHLYHFHIPQIVVIIAVENGSGQVFVEPTYKYVSELHQRIEAYETLQKEQQQVGMG